MKNRAISAKTNLRWTIKVMDVFAWIAFFVVVTSRWRAWDRLTVWVVAFGAVLPWVQSFAIKEHGPGLDYGNGAAVAMMPAVMFMRSIWDCALYPDFFGTLNARGWLLVCAIAAAYAYMIWGTFNATSKKASERGPMTLALKILLALLFGFVYSGSLWRLVDGYADRSVPTFYDATVEKQWSAHGARSGTSYYIKVAPWGPRHESSEIEVSPEIFDDSPPSSVVRIGLCEGALGWPWICSLRPLRTSAADQFEGMKVSYRAGRLMALFLVAGLAVMVIALRYVGKRRLSQADLFG